LAEVTLDDIAKQETARKERERRANTRSERDQERAFEQPECRATS
jgi:hypothetical protein